jgi:2-phosphosulfolactate phosphatase
MKIDVFFSPPVVAEAALEDRAAVVIDVIRATSSALEALANGAKAIIPTVSTEDAVRLASSLGREDTLLCGERKGIKVEGFDLGNSPAEYRPEVVEGKQLVMTTTNGTRALLAAEGARRVLAASFMNLSSVVASLQGEEALVMICAGRENRFALEDALCAGAIIRELTEEAEEPILNDAGRVALDLALKYPMTAEFLGTTSAGQALQDLGFEEDLALCASVNRHTLVPEMGERKLTLLAEAPEDGDGTQEE